MHVGLDLVENNEIESGSDSGEQIELVNCMHTNFAFMIN